MLAPGTLRTLSFEDAAARAGRGAAFVDLRDVDEYLDVHIPGSIALLYEFGPGMASRARDCVPLEVPLLLLDLGDADLHNAAASLRGKGFDVVGMVEDGINQWAGVVGPPASTEVIRGAQQPAGTILDVGDPGAIGVRDPLRIPAERLWAEVERARGLERVVVAAGYGIRAALTVGILERAGVEEIAVWKTRA